MIIECINCNKIFEVNSELIPSNGRTIQCGSCGHIWFYKHGILSINKQTKKKIINQKDSFNKKEKPILEEKILSKKNDKFINKNETALIKYEKKSKFTFLDFLSYVIVSIISLIGLIIILDTFQIQLSSVYPNLELLLFNLYEIIKDIYLFLKDLIK